MTTPPSKHSDYAASPKSSLRKALAQPKGPEIKRSRFTKDQIIDSLKEPPEGMAAPSVRAAMRRNKTFLGNDGPPREFQISDTGSCPAFFALGLPYADQPFGHPLAGK